MNKREKEIMQKMKIRKENMGNFFFIFLYFSLFILFKK